MQGVTGSMSGRVCAAYGLPVSRDIDPRCCVGVAPGYLKLRVILRQLVACRLDVVPQPAHSSHSVTWSVVRAMRASHSASGWACKAACHAAHLEPIRSARESLHRSSSEQSAERRFFWCPKGLKADTAPFRGGSKVALCIMPTAVSPLRPWAAESEGLGLRARA